MFVVMGYIHAHAQFQVILQHTLISRAIYIISRYRGGVVIYIISRVIFKKIVSLTVLFTDDLRSD